MRKKKVVIYGAGGYGGVGLVENLLSHSGVEIAALVSRDGAGDPISKMYPHLEGRCDLLVEHADNFEPEGRGEFVFFSTPDGVGQLLARRYLDAGYKVLDFSGDFRFSEGKIYRQYSAWQQGECEHGDEDLLKESVYGWPELYRKELKSTRLAGNPGCMAICCLLAMRPALASKQVKVDSVVANVLTGISGGGKKPKAGFHFPAAQENVYAYKIGKHQHLFELERELSIACEEDLRINFTPHVVPMTRGILATCYLKLKSEGSFETLKKAYEEAYKNEPFVSLVSAPPQTLHVRGSNQCRIHVTFVERTQTVVVVAAIDNLQKGQSGNAVQVMNIMLGLPESSGVDALVRYP